MTRRVVSVAILPLLLAQCMRERPVTSTNLGDVALANARFTWDSIPDTGFTLYTLRGSYGGERAAQYRDEVAGAIAHALRMLGESRYPDHLRLFVLSSREDVEAVTGTGTNGWGDPIGRTAGVVARPECRPVIRHEVMHAVSLALWGMPFRQNPEPQTPEEVERWRRGGWLREGIAAAAENLYLTYTYRGMAAQWQAEGGLLPLDSLDHAFYRHDDLSTYLQSGSLVMYLLERYGAERFHQLWREGTDALERIYGRTHGRLEAEWQGWLRATPASERPRSIADARAEDICPKRRT